MVENYYPRCCEGFRVANAIYNFKEKNLLSSVFAEAACSGEEKIEHEEMQVLTLGLWLKVSGSKFPY